MLKFVKLAALSALIGIGALGAVPASAQSGVYLGLGGGHRGGPELSVRIGDSGRSYHRHQDRRWAGSHRNDRNYRACQPRQAANKAKRMGVRGARVTDVGRQAIRVTGKVRSQWVSMRFARAPGCPVIR